MRKKRSVERMVAVLLGLCAAMPVTVRLVRAQATAPGDAATVASVLPSRAPSEHSNIVHITLGESVVPLNGPWKFHIGDSPIDPKTGGALWAEVDFDDSGWETVDLTPTKEMPDVPMGGYTTGWGARGHAGYSGYGWYRLRVQIAGSPSAPLALEGPLDINDDFEAFDNAVSLGGLGHLSVKDETPSSASTVPMTFPLRPLSASGNGEQESGHLLAFRTWASPFAMRWYGAEGGGIRSAPLAGTALAIGGIHLGRWVAMIRDGAENLILLTLYLLLTSVAFTLFFFDRSDHAYLWLAADLLLLSQESFLRSLGSWIPSISPVTAFWIERPLAPISWFVWMMLWWAWFRLRRPAWILKAYAGLLALYLILDVSRVEAILSGHDGPMPDLLFRIDQYGIYPVTIVAPLAVVVLGIRKRRLEGLLALPAVLIEIVPYISDTMPSLGLPDRLNVFGLQITLNTIADLAFLAVMFLLMIRRLARSLGYQRRMALDFKQAQEVQRVLLPESIVLPNLTIESEYHPARDVGGDFVQIIPHATDGSVLIVAGDVTGKGLPAGMLVALLVGAIRTAAELSTEPRVILEALNRRLLGRSEAFATCLAMNIHTQGELAGTVELANAGHLAPYLNGIEVPMEGALPLGMLAAAEFPESQFAFASGDTLTLISDGVLEAQNGAGQLFGFERVRELLQTKLSAAALAAAAKVFGQTDDISVVSVTRGVAVSSF